ncbi:MAG: DUF1501 domain-containing protein [Chitinophagaceae bacterium]|nr:DUF1501 domain-containing protein [Chitinophagaceae bacterium]
MNRRNFIRNTMGLGFTPIFLNNSFIKAYNNLPAFNDFTCGDIQGRSLVFIDLFGGNDGINTVIPVQQSKYDLYAQNRPTIAIPRTGNVNGAILLDSTITESRQISLHPAMTGLKELYDNGKLNVVNGVGYLNNNKSHFAANSHWLSGGDSTPEFNKLNSGWIGRYLGSVYPSNIGGPTADFPDPLGLEFGANSSSFLFNTSEGSSASIILRSNPSTFYNQVAGLGVPLPTNYSPSHFKDEIEYINSIERSTNAFSERVTNVFNNGTNAVSYPDTVIANQLKTVVRMISGGSKTKIFLVHLTGFDNHTNQVVAGTPTTGIHANLLKLLSDAIKVFQSDLEALGLEDRVITSTYSEFGRSIDQNASSGTDHGGVNPMFIIGKGVKPGVTGNPIDLTKVVDRGCTDLQFDYRSIYATLLQDFLAVDDAVLAAALPPQFVENKTAVLNPTYVAPASCYSTFSALPIVLTDFTATPIGNEAVRINWSTSQETNTRDFVLERSNDAVNFTPIARIPAAGNSYGPQQYEWLDYDAAEGVNYYRLLQSDFDDKYEYFGPVRVTLRKTRITNIKSYPNPSVNEFTLSISSASRQKADIVIMDMEGHPLYKMPAQLTAGSNTFQFNHLQFRGTNQLLIAVRLENGKLETLKHLMQ